jgi:hypothetical protein
MAARTSLSVGVRPIPAFPTPTINRLCLEHPNQLMGKINKNAESFSFILIDGTKFSVFFTNM